MQSRTQVNGSELKGNAYGIEEGTHWEPTEERVGSGITKHRGVHNGTHEKCARTYGESKENFGNNSLGNLQGNGKNWRYRNGWGMHSETHGNIREM